MPKVRMLAENIVEQDYTEDRSLTIEEIQQARRLTESMTESGAILKVLLIAKGISAIGYHPSEREQDDPGYDISHCAFVVGTGESYALERFNSGFTVPYQRRIFEDRDQALQWLRDDTEKQPA